MYPYSDAGRIHTMDLLFSSLLFFFSAWSYTQTMIYPSDKPYSYTVALSYGSIIFFVIAAFAEGYGNLPMEKYLHVSLLTYCALMKALSTGSKFAYQVFLNFKKKSTRGVSATTMAVDLCGATLAMVDM